MSNKLPPRLLSYRETESTVLTGADTRDDLGVTPQADELTRIDSMSSTLGHELSSFQIGLQLLLKILRFTFVRERQLVP